MYIKRALEADIKKALACFPAILITGARQVGKSTLALQLPNINYITLDDTTSYSFAKDDPHGFIASLSRPVVIDEIQKIPELLTPIKKEIDTNRQNGQFVLTGSANIIAFGNISETLAGRIVIFDLYPFTQKELARKDENFIKMLFDNLNTIDRNDVDLPSVKSSILKGGYPELQHIDDPRMRYMWLSSYIRTYIERDVRDIGALRNLDGFILMYNMLATRSASILNKTDLASKSRIDMKTLNNYLSLLEQVYQLKMLQPFSRNIGKRLIKNPKAYLCDSGVLCHLLQVRSVEELDASPFKGSILETFIFNELYRHLAYCGENIRMSYLRTKDRKEIDFILEKGEETIAIEVKYSQSVTHKEFRHIDTVDSHGDIIGIILYLGNEKVVLNKKRIALPINSLF